MKNASRPDQEAVLAELETLVSESRNSATLDLDTLPTAELLARLNAEDHKVASAVQAELPAIAATVDAVIAAFKRGGRLIYLGAGTSGRLGVLDAAECPPTFGVAPDRVIGLIAGGPGAMFEAVEGAEDDLTLAETDLRARQFSADDVLIGIAASGRTPYVLGGLRYARSIGATTVALTCNPHATLADEADIAIAPLVGPEALTGSTRLKCGSAHKMVLNLISTAAMIGLGKIYENLMVDLNPSNDKLRARAVRMVATATGLSLEAARAVLERCAFSPKLAILVQLTGLEPAAATRHLDAHAGFLRAALASVPCR